jgi:hypothetical protein
MTVASLAKAQAQLRTTRYTALAWMTILTTAAVFLFLLLFHYYEKEKE